MFKKIKEKLLRIKCFLLKNEFDAMYFELLIVLLAKTFLKFRNALFPRVFKGYYVILPIKFLDDEFIISRSWAIADFTRRNASNLNSKFISLLKKNADFLYKRGIELLASNDLNLATDFLINAYTITQHLNKESPEYKNAYYILLPNAMVKRGKEFISEGYFSEAAYHVREALYIDPNHSEAKKLIKVVIDKSLSDNTKKILELNNKQYNNKKITLSDLPSITQEEFKFACKTIKNIQQIINDRENYIQKKNLDSKKAKPKGNWENRSDYKFITTLKFDIINNFRLYCQFFTGKSLKYIIDSNYNLKASMVNDWQKYTHNLPKELIAQPPKMLGEIGFNINGNLVNNDIIAYQERLYLIYRSGLFDILKKRENLKILEIGSGYGALSYFLKKALPKCQYYLIDIPESLYFCTVYLGLSMPKESHFIYTGDDCTLLERNCSFFYMPNYTFSDLKGIPFDLVINTLSFSELSQDQVLEYALGIKELIGKNGFLFEQNHDNRGFGFVCAQDIIGKVFHKRIFSEVHRNGTANVWKN